MLLTVASSLANEESEAAAVKTKSDVSACKIPKQDLNYITFQKTCKNIHLKGCIVDAECQKRDGSWRETDGFDVRWLNKGNSPQCHQNLLTPPNMVNEDGKICCGYAGTPQLCGS